MSPRWRLLFGILGASLGSVLFLAGVAILVGQLAQYVETLHWSGYSLLELIKSPTVKSTLPGALQSWLYRPEQLHGFHAAAVGLLEIVPAFVFFIGLGGVILRKALR